MTNLRALVLATGKLYWKSLAVAGKGWRLNWYWGLAAPVAYLLVLSLLSPLLFGLLGPVAGGFASGILLALALANYLSFISAACSGERVARREIWERTREIVFPLIGVLFLLWILSLFSSVALARPSQQWIRAALNCVIVVLFNPLPEVIYQKGSDSFSSFAESLEFMRENSVEWIAAMAILLAPLWLWDPVGTLAVVAGSDPVNVVFGLLAAFGGLASGSGLLWAAVYLLLGFYVMIVRGVLFSLLSHSSRRKRIYDGRFR